MGRAKCDIRIGTSGWYYQHWTSRFYPEDLKKNNWFKYYAENFDTVEINSSFYHLPKPQSVKNWYRQAPRNFIYVVKANRYITHIKRLKNAEEAVPRFFESVSLLKEKLGAILYQLPPNFHKDLDLLANFIKLLPKEIRGVFEFRHNSWFDDETYEFLNDNGLGFCIHDLAGVPTPRVITARLIYIRFHGPTGRYAGNYTTPQLKTWSQWIKKNINQAENAYAYFNNDINANAIQNAKQLRKQIQL